jgi:hypothetical protein
VRVVAVVAGSLVLVAAWDRLDVDVWPGQVHSSAAFARGVLGELRDHGADLGGPVQIAGLAAGGFPRFWSPSTWRRRSRHGRAAGQRAGPAGCPPLICQRASRWPPAPAAGGRGPARCRATALTSARRGAFIVVGQPPPGRARCAPAGGLAGDRHHRG